MSPHALPKVEPLADDVSAAHLIFPCLWRDGTDDAIADLKVLVILVVADLIRNGFRVVRDIDDDFRSSVSWQSRRPLWPTP